VNLFLVVWKLRADEGGAWLAEVSVAPAAFLTEAAALVYAEENLANAPADGFQVVAVGMDLAGVQASLAAEIQSGVEGLVSRLAAVEARLAVVEAR